MAVISPRPVKRNKIVAKLSDTLKKLRKTPNKTCQTDIISGTTLKAGEEDLLYK
jgi:hypothetical protein